MDSGIKSGLPLVAEGNSITKACQTYHVAGHRDLGNISLIDTIGFGDTDDLTDEHI